MAYQDYMYGKYSYESRVRAQSHDLVQKAKDAGASPEVIICMKESLLSGDYINLRHIEEVFQPMYVQRINDGTLQSSYDEYLAEQEVRNKKYREMEEAYNQEKKNREEGKK